MMRCGDCPRLVEWSRCSEAKVERSTGNHALLIALAIILRDDIE